MFGGAVASGVVNSLICRGMTPIHAPAATERRDRRTPSRWALILGVSVVAIVVAHLLDARAWTFIKDPRVYDRDWGRMLRSAGFLPTWFIVAVALWGSDRPAAGSTSDSPSGTSAWARFPASRGWAWRGGMMALAPTAGGAVAELLKLVVRRLRPGDASSAYAFRAFSDGPWSNRGMGMPSSHVLVAMSAATVLARMFPRVRWMWYAIVAGCAYTRIAANAHYLSDTVVAAVLGWLVGDAFAAWGGIDKKPPEA
jgi:membrane-associated phospholipid phosphatase